MCFRSDQAWKNNTDQTYSCPRDRRLSRHQGDQFEGSLKPRVHQSTIVSKGLRGYPYLGSHYEISRNLAPLVLEICRMIRRTVLREVDASPYPGDPF